MLQLAMGRESLLHVSAVIYGHLQGEPKYTKRHTQRYGSALSFVTGEIHNVSIPLKRQCVVNC
jgi:hypothetical protein